MGYIQNFVTVDSYIFLTVNSYIVLTANLNSYTSRLCGACDNLQPPAERLKAILRRVK